MECQNCDMGMELCQHIIRDEVTGEFYYCENCGEQVEVGDEE